MIEAIVSFDPKGRPSGEELLRIDYGKVVGAMKGRIHRRTSFWTIDESGSVGRTEKSKGKAVTYSAVTQLDKVDYRSLFKDIPKEVHDDGSEEIHYRFLRKNDMESLTQLVERIGEAPFLILSYPVMKDHVNTAPKRGDHRNAFYVLEAIQSLVAAIETVDRSKTIIVTFDRTDEIPEDILQVASTKRTTVLMSKADAFELLEVSDIAASVTNNGINYQELLDTNLFWSLYPINTNISERGKATTAGIDRVSDEGGCASRYNKIRTNGMIAC